MVGLSLLPMVARVCVIAVGEMDPDARTMTLVAGSAWSVWRPADRAVPLPLGADLDSLRDADLIADQQANDLLRGGAAGRHDPYRAFRYCTECFSPAHIMSHSSLISTTSGYLYHARRKFYKSANDMCRSGDLSIAWFAHLNRK